jgi:aspartate/methionine/tyrosine aminotransferase
MLCFHIYQSTNTNKMQWMDEYEVTPGVLNIAETCAASVSINDLLALSEDPNIPHPIDLSKKLTYGSIRGSDALRERLASLYSVRTSTPLPKDNVLITQGAINANFLILYTLIGPGDHVVCMHPTYQQLYDVPKSLGAEVSLWKLRRENKYIPDIEDLKGLVKDNTKLIIINNPNNPTGATTPKSILKKLVEYAKEKDIIILSDEVYRPLFHGIGPMDDEFPPSILSLGYSKTISTGSMSKAYSLAGIRCGWIASRDRLIIEAVATARDYTTISVSQLDDAVASFALSNSVLHALLGRNIKLAKTNFAILESFINENSHICSWVKPTGGTTALVKFEQKGVPVDDVQFCKDVIEKTKVMFVPASKCFGAEFKGSVRIGFVSETEVLRKALEVLGPYIRQTLS